MTQKRVIAVGRIKRRPVSNRLPRGKVVVAGAGLGSVEVKGSAICIMQHTSGGAPSRHIWAPPPNILLTEEARGLMQEDGGYLLLDI